MTTMRPIMRVITSLDESTSDNLGFDDDCFWSFRVGGIHSVSLSITLHSAQVFFSASFSHLLITLDTLALNDAPH